MIMQIAEYIGLIVIILCFFPGLMFWITMALTRGGLIDSDKTHELFEAWEDFIEQDAL